MLHTNSRTICIPFPQDESKKRNVLSKKTHQISTRKTLCGDYQDETCIQLEIIEDRFSGHGGIVWDAALCLGHYLTQSEEVKCMHPSSVCIEVGAGVGIPGLTAWYLGYHTLLTDKPQLVHLLQQNIQLAIENIDSEYSNKMPMLLESPFLFGANPRRLPHIWQPDRIRHKNPMTHRKRNVPCPTSVEASVKFHPSSSSITTWTLSDQMSANPPTLPGSSATLQVNQESSLESINNSKKSQSEQEMDGIESINCSDQLHAKQEWNLAKLDNCSSQSQTKQASNFAELDICSSQLQTEQESSLAELDDLDNGSNQLEKLYTDTHKKRRLEVRNNICVRSSTARRDKPSTVDGTLEQSHLAYQTVSPSHFNEKISKNNIHPETSTESNHEVSETSIESNHKMSKNIRPETSIESNHKISKNNNIRPETSMEFNPKPGRYTSHLIHQRIILASDILGCSDSGAFDAILKTFEDLTHNCTKHMLETSIDASHNKTHDTIDTSSDTNGYEEVTKHRYTEKSTSTNLTVCSNCQSHTKILMSYKPRADFEDKFFEWAEDVFEVKQVAEYTYERMQQLGFYTTESLQQSIYIYSFTPKAK